MNSLQVRLLPPRPLPSIPGSSSATLSYHETLLPSSSSRNLPSYVREHSNMQNGALVRGLGTAELIAIANDPRLLSCPVGWLPFELLAHIFEYAVEEDLSLLGHLQRVSRTWRAVVVNCPQLWAHIGVLGPFNISKMEIYRRHIDSCRDKSGPYRLHVTFDPSFFSRRTTLIESVKAAHGLLNYLSTQASSKWEYLHLTFGRHRGFYDNMYWSVVILLERAIGLKHLVIYDKGGVTSHQAVWASISTHSLQTLELMSEHAPPKDMQFRNIRELTLYWPTYERPVTYTHLSESLLPSFPSIRRLVLKGNDLPEPQELPRATFYTAKFLSTLEIHGQPSTWHLRGVALPALQHLTICATKGSHHFLSDSGRIVDLDATNVKYLTLKCAKGELFWSLQGDDHAGSRYADQLSIQSHFQNFPSLEIVTASGCIWWQVMTIFDNFDESIEEAAQSRLCELHKISAARLYEFISLGNSCRHNSE